VTLPSQIARHGPARQAISRGVVALTKKYVGRGPTNARAYVEDDLVTVLLHETLTTVEKTLAEAGSGDVVTTMREDFDSAMCAEAIELVEQEMGRKVEAMMTGHSIETDHSVLCFVLAPPAADPASPCDDPGLGGTNREPARTSS
jgi:uncharacterized protein YbcI